jgi:hypothetical protein
MNSPLVVIGRFVGVLGVLICAVAAGVRVQGNYMLSGFPVGTLFIGGVAAMVAGCLFILLALASRR